jgi:hypothetical protein
MTREQPQQPPGPPPRRKPRDVRTVRLADPGWEAFQRIADDRTAKTGKNPATGKDWTRSDVIRLALAEYAQKHDPARRKR